MSETTAEVEPGVEEEIAEAMAEDEDTAEPGEPAYDETEEAQAAADREAELRAEQQEAAQTAKKFDRAVKTYFDKMHDLFGDDFNLLEPCPRCSETWPGLIWPHATRPPLPDTIAAVKLSLGEGVEPDYQTSDRAATCQKCDGYGKVTTGSKVRGHERIVCGNCQGTGWTGPAKQDASSTPQPQSIAAVNEDTGEIEEKPQTDPWGRPKGDRLYGVMPGFEPE